MNRAAIDNFRGHSVLSELCDPLPRLRRDPDEDTERSIISLAGGLGPATEPASMSLQIHGDTAARYWRIQIGPDGAKAIEEGAEPSLTDPVDVEIITREETWRLIADGTASLVDAWVDGQLRFRGNIVVLYRLVRQLRQSRRT